MRKIWFMALMLVGVLSLQAQDVKPLYEVEDNMVKATYFHENGEVAQTGYYYNGKLHGQWKMYNDQGKKIAMGQYIEGKRSGKWFFWKEEVLQEVDYAENAIAHVVEWSNGEAVVVNK